MAASGWVPFVPPSACTPPSLLAHTPCPLSLPDHGRGLLPPDWDSPRPVICASILAVCLHQRPGRIWDWSDGASFLASKTTTGSDNRLVLQDAESNTFLSLLAESASKLSFAHAWYGVGAFVSPLIASGFFVTLPSPGFFHFYRWTAVLGALNLAAMAYNFTGERGGVTSQGDGDGSVGGGEKQDDPQGTLGKVLRQPIVHLISAFLFVYVGYEVSISGFAPSYLAEIRKAPEDKAGFSSAGFWGGEWLSTGKTMIVRIHFLWLHLPSGLTLGRFVLIPVSKRVSRSLLEIVLSALTYLSCSSANGLLSRST